MKKQLEIFEDGEIALHVPTIEGKVYLSQEQIAELGGLQQPNVSRSLGDMIEAGVLDPKMIYQIDISHQDTKGTARKTHSVKHYPLKAVLFVLGRAHLTE